METEPVVQETEDAKIARKRAEYEAEREKERAEEKAEVRAKIGVLVDRLGDYIAAIVTDPIGMHRDVLPAREALVDAIAAMDD